MREFTVHRSGGVAIAGDSIVAVGPDALAFDAAATIDCGGRVVMPGLVNAHTHVPMALLRGLADDLRLDVWLMGYMMPVEREFVSARLRPARHAARLRRDDPVRRHLLRRHVLLRGSGRRSDRRGRHAGAVRADRAPFPDARCDAATKTRWPARASSSRRWQGHPLIVPAPAPHAPYTCTPEILRVLRRAGGGVRRAAAHPSVRDRCSKSRNRARVHGMPVRAVGARSRACSTPRCWPRTACTWTTARCAR